jgi:hypothetical protein
MTHSFLRFFVETTRVNFISTQNEVFEHPEYNPHSEDIAVLKDLIDRNDFTKAVEWNNINTILSPRIHLLKHFALQELNRENDARSELILANKILKGISLTGDGSMEHPYIVTRVSDEYDMLMYLKEKFSCQFLLNSGDKMLDLIMCESNNKIYFDITRPYYKMKDFIN